MSSHFKWIKLVCLLAGMALLVLVVSKIDLDETASLAVQVGPGLILILLAYLAAFAMDSVSWQLTLRSIPVTWRWACRFFQIRLAAEAFNTITPAAGMGGEPLKAILLKTHHGVAYQDGIASLVLAKTINVMMLVVFLVIGFVLMLEVEGLGQSYTVVAATGLAALITGVALFFIVQRFRLLSVAHARLGGRSWPDWAVRAIAHITSVEERLSRFYIEEQARLVIALTLAMFNWILGAAEIYLTFWLLGHPVTVAEAWVIEAVAQLVRAGMFFIPASIGVQEGVLVLVGAAITGSPTVGFAVAVVRRIRELVWIVWGLLVFSVLKPASGTTR